jgi:hypothetical protein
MIASSVDSGQSVVTHRTRWCRGGTPDQGEPVGGGRAEGAHHSGRAAVGEDDGMWTMATTRTGGKWR